MDIAQKRNYVKWGKPQSQTMRNGFYGLFVERANSYPGYNAAREILKG